MPKLGQKGISLIFVILILLATITVGVLIQQYTLHQTFSQQPISCGGDWNYNVKCPLGSYCHSQGPLVGGFCTPYLSPLFGRPQNKPQPTPPQQTTQPPSTPSDEMTDWKTFSNTVVGLSLRYPPNWEVYCGKEHVASSSCSNSEQSHFFFAGTESFIIYRLRDRKSNESLNETFDRLAGGNSSERGKTITVNGLPAWTMNSSSGKQVYIVNNSQVWLISMALEGKTDEYTIHKDMLNSLRFSR